MKWNNFMTVEPAIFFQRVGDTITYVTYQALYIEKICKNDLGYSADTCDETGGRSDSNITIDQELLQPIMNDIQIASSQYQLYLSIIENLFPVILVLFLGVWSDQTKRRKPSLILSLTGRLLRAFGLLINSYFLNWTSLVLLLTTSLPGSLSGGLPVFYMAVYSYISDTSRSGARTWKMGIAEICMQLGVPLGLFLGTILNEKGGYLLVFGTNCACQSIALLYSIFILPEVKPLLVQDTNSQGQGQESTGIVNAKLSNSKAELLESSLTFQSKNKYNSYGTCNNVPEVPKTITYYSKFDKDNNNVEYGHIESDLVLGKQAQNHQHGEQLHPLLQNHQHQESSTSKIGAVYEFLTGSFRAVMRQRANHRRMCLISLGIIMLLYCVANSGLLPMKFLYVRQKFQWGEQEYGTWVTFESLCQLFGFGVVVPISIKLLKLSDPMAGFVGSVAKALGLLCEGLAQNSFILYLGSILCIFGTLILVSARSFASKCVDQNERGRIFSLLGCIEALVPLFAGPLFSIVFSSTLTFEPAAIYYLSTGICFSISIIFGALFIAVKKGTIQLLSESPTIELANEKKTVMMGKNKNKPESEVYTASD